MAGRNGFEGIGANAGAAEFVAGAPARRKFASTAAATGRLLMLTCFFYLLVSAVSVGPVRAQDTVDPNASVQSETGGAFGQAEVSAQQQLENSLAELTALREEIAEEKIPLSRKLSALEDQLRKVRREYQETTRLLDSRTLDLSNLRTEIQSRREERTYLSNLLSEYIRNFETRLHIAELQLYREPLEAAKLAPENSNLSETEIYQTQAALVSVSLERLYEALGGTRFEGQAVDPSGLVKPGTFALVGPVALFRSQDGESVGTAEQRLGSLEPTVLTFESQAMTRAADEMITKGTGRFPLDPTLGNAHKIEATKQTLGEHVSKGGVVMYPILGLFGAVVLVAIYKWVELSRLRKPSSKRIQAMVQAIAQHDDRQAAQEARAIGGPTGEMLLAGVEHIREPAALIEEVMYEKILAAKLKLQRFLPFIAISAAAAPLLGLLGTVTGIINTFKLITVFGSGDVKTLSGGISEALITTEFGLIVAIPSLLSHAFLSRKARGMIAQMEKAAIAFINQISKTPYRSDDLAGALAEMPTAVAHEVLRNLKHEGGREAREIMPYSADSAGSIMVPVALCVRQSATVAEALRTIRAAHIEEDLHSVFVVNEQGRYVGTVPVRLLLTRPEQTRIESLVETDTLFVRVDTDQREVRSLIHQHDLAAMPVLDHEDQLVGRVTRNGE